MKEFGPLPGPASSSDESSSDELLVARSPSSAPPRGSTAFAGAATCSAMASATAAFALAASPAHPRVLLARLPGSASSTGGAACRRAALLALRFFSGCTGSGCIGLSAPKASAGAGAAAALALRFFLPSRPVLPPSLPARASAPSAQSSLHAGGVAHIPLLITTMYPTYSVLELADNHLLQVSVEVQSFHATGPNLPACEQGLTCAIQPHSEEPNLA